MSKELPFDEDVMTLIMGLGGPETPGQHGRLNTPKPDHDAISTITEIRDLCEKFLEKCGKSESPEKGDETGDEKPSDDMNEEKEKDKEE